MVSPLTSLISAMHRPRDELHERAATEGDLPALAALDAACFGNPWSAEVYRQELVRPFADLRLLRRASTLAGLCCTWWMGEEAHLLRIATEPALRRRGLARQMLTGALTRATQAGCRQLLLEVAASNEPAVGLYRAFGFEVIGRRRGYYRKPPDDALVMVCRLRCRTPLE